MYKVVLWDIDGTLLDFHAAEKAAIRSLFVDFGFGECTDAMLADYSQINRGYWQALERGEMTKPEILIYRFRDFFEKYGLNAHKAVEFNGRYQLALGDTIVFAPGGLEAVKAFDGKVLQCAVTNGTKAAQDKKLKASGLVDYFQHIFISDVIGIEKPGIGFFDAVWNEIGHFAKDEVIIIGDSLTSDMQGGVNAGITTCWYNPKGAENTSDIKLDYEIRDLSQLINIVL